MYRVVNHIGRNGMLIGLGEGIPVTSWRYEYQLRDHDKSWITWHVNGDCMFKYIPYKNAFIDNAGNWHI